MYNNAIEIIDDIYQEGDIDLVFFGQLLFYVSARRIGNGEAISHGKPDKQCISDALRLAKFCISGGDFYVHRGHRNDDGSFSYLRFENDMAEFEDFVWAQFLEEGIDGINLFFATSLVKFLPGRKPPAVPPDIAALLEAHFPRSESGDDFE